MARPTTRAFILLLALVPAAAYGAEAADLPEQRLACQEEARRNIKGPKQVDLDLYRRLVDRRQLYVRDCMIGGLQDVEQTGAIAIPVPPRAPRT